MTLLKNSLSPLLYKSDPTLYGWCYKDNILTKIAWTKNQLAPTDMISLTMCSCKQSRSTIIIANLRNIF